MTEALNHPILTHPHYNTILLSWQNGGLHFFKALPVDGSGILIIDTYYFAYLLTFVFSALFVRWAFKQGRIHASKQQVFDAFIASGLGLMIGAKLFYVLFYNLDFYLRHPSQILLNWSGMASHGAIFGGASALVLFCWKRKTPLWNFLDHGLVCASMAPIFVRAANFLNAELFGRSAPDWLPWRMRFPMRGPQGQILFVGKDSKVYELHEFAENGKRLAEYFVTPAKEIPKHAYESFQRIQEVLPQQVFSIHHGSEAGPIQNFARLITDPSHPSQIYQLIISGILLLSLMFYFYRKKLKDGQLTAIFLILYPISRISMEYFRQQDPQRDEGLFQMLSMGQLLSLVMLAVGIILYFKVKRSGSKD